MPSKALDDLLTANTLDGTELVYLEQSGNSRKKTVAGLLAEMGVAGYGQEWAPNFNDNGEVFIPANVAMTIDQGNAPVGTGALAYAKSTAAAPDTFTACTLPADLEAGAWLQVIATGVVTALAAHLIRTA